MFASGDKAQAARDAGADLVGMEDLAEQVKAGKIDFDVVIAAPDAMRVVGQLGQILGPRGLMPNPKVGTVTPDVAGAVRNARAGQVQFRADKAGHRAMHDRPRLVHAGAAARQPGGAGGRGEQVQAGRHQGDFSEEAFGVEHDGSRREGRPGVALGTAMTLAVVVKDRRSRKCRA